MQDVAGIAFVHVRSWNETYRGLLPDAVIDRRTIPEREASWQRTFEHGEEQIWVAESEAMIVGFSSVQLQDDVAFVETLYVLQAWQGFGIGSALFEKAFELAKSQGKRLLRLHTLTTNQRARKFYEDRGGAYMGEHHNQGFQTNWSESIYEWTIGDK